MNRIHTLFAYLYAVFVDSGQRVLTFISIIGLVPIFFPDIAERFGIHEVISRSIGIAIVVVSFVLANYKLFESSHSAKSKLLLGRRSTSLHQFVSVTNKGFAVAEDIEVEFVIFFDVLNSEQSPTFVDFSIDIINSEWHPAGDLSKVEFKIDSRPSPGNRLRIQGLETGERRVEFILHFESPSDKMNFRYLGSLSKLIVMLNVKPQHSREYRLPVEFNVTEIKNRITEYLIQQGTGMLHRQGLVETRVADFVSILKNYWGVEDK